MSVGFQTLQDKTGPFIAGAYLAIWRNAAPDSSPPISESETHISHIRNFLKNAFDSATVFGRHQAELSLFPPGSVTTCLWCAASPEMLVCVNMCKYLRLCDKSKWIKIFDHPTKNICILGKKYFIHHMQIPQAV